MNEFNNIDNIYYMSQIVEYTYLLQLERYCF